MSDGDGENLKVTLYCREGTSDKVYVAEVVKQGSGYVVNVAYGRRGGTLTKGTKTPKPLTNAKADRICADLVMEKLAKGYSHLPPDDDDAAPSPRAARAKGWEHPELGRFKYEGDAWVRTVDAPAFKAAGFGGRSKKCELSFDTDDETEMPSPEAVKMALHVLAKQDAVAKAVRRAMWDDVCGRGPDSGMYWHGDIEQLVEGIDDFDGEPAPPKSAEDLARLMSLNGIKMTKPRRRGEAHLAELDFAADFEEEHGVGVLTDGKSVVGIGYSSDVTPFKKPRAKR